MKKPKVASFAELINWIAANHHGGNVLPIAGRIGVSSAIVGFWSRGETKRPQVENLQRLAEAYDLDFLWLLGLVHGKKLAPISGGSGWVESPPVAYLRERLSLIRRWLPTLAWPLLSSCPA